MKLSEIQTKAQFKQKLSSPVLSKLLAGLDKFKEGLRGIGWDVDYTVNDSGTEVSVVCSKTSGYNAADWIKRWRIYDESFLSDLSEGDIEIEMVDESPDQLIFNIVIL
jgi:hypothetical protein